VNAFRWQFVWPVALGTLCLVGLCAFTAVSLFHEQATITGVLRENVSSRRAASDLRATLNTLVALEAHQVEAVSELHTRAAGQLGDVRRFANTPRERELSTKLDGGFAAYLHAWQSLPPKGDPAHAARVTAASDFLEANVLLVCRDVEAFNDERVEETTLQHERVLNQLAWGMAVVGALGAIAGVVFGYGVARVVSRSLRQLRVQVRDAAGKIGPEPTEIVLTGEAGFGGLQNELEDLTARIEGVVQQLHDREREVIRAEQLAAVGQLAAGVGHELRNPLTSIKMLVQTGLEPGGAALTAEDLAIIESEVRRMERSLQTFLDFARPPQPERRSVELQPLLEGVLGLIRGRAEKQRVAARLRAEPLTLTADAGQLQQVFVNLVLNALDAMPGGGELAVAVRRSDRWAEVEVADTGPGVAREMMARLFEPFASTKDTGLGLGLVISKRIVEDHGGTLGAANRPTGGACFFVRLPIDEPRDS